MTSRSKARHALESDLRRALVPQQFEISCQPLIDIRMR
jgi:sensor c-di-GMP phosphodiesterase-like protein